MHGMALTAHSGHRWSLKMKSKNDCSPRVSFGSHPLLTVLSCTPKPLQEFSWMVLPSLPWERFPFQVLSFPGDTQSFSQVHSLRLIHVSHVFFPLYDLCMLSSFQHLPNPTSLAAADSMEPTCGGRPQIYLPVGIRQAPPLLVLSLNFWENTSHTWKCELEISSWKIFFSDKSQVSTALWFSGKLSLTLFGSGPESKASLKWKIIFRRAKNVRPFVPIATGSFSVG